MYLMKTIALLFLLSLVLANDVSDPDHDFMNDLEDPLEIECKTGYGLFRVKSEYAVTGNVPKEKRYNSHPDRRWAWQCRKIDIWSKEYCVWYDGINALGATMFFQCPANAFMAGVRSEYNIDAEDRSWDVKCCRILGVCMQHCSLTDFLASSTEPFDHSPEDDNAFFIGFFSKYINSDGDREYRLEECQCGSCSHPNKYAYKK